MRLVYYITFFSCFSEHVWQVTMQKRGLGARKNIHGPYRLCLTDQTLSLVKIGAQDNSDSIEISVSLREI